MAKQSEIEPEYLIPLSPTDYQILLALAGRPLHGLGVIRQCEHESDGIIRLSPGTAYPALRRLSKFGYLKCIEKTPGQGSNHLKSTYQLTPTGWAVFTQETSRLRQATTMAATLLADRARPAKAWSDTIKAL